MGVAWTRLGTVSVTAGSVNVQGVDTRWQTAASIGDAFHAPDGKQYEVADITSDTALQLRTPYQGATAAGQAYAIMRIVPQGSDAETMALLRQVLNLTDTQLTAFMAWADSQGVVSISDGETTLPGLHGLRKLMADIATKAPSAGPVFTGTMWAESITWTSDKQYIGRTFGRLSTAPGEGLGTDPLAGRYGLALTYNVRPSASGGYESIGGGRAGALAIDEGRLSWSRGSETSASSQQVTFTTELYVSAAGNTVLGGASDDGDKLQVSGIATAAGFRHRSYTRATVPSASAYARCTIYVSDAVGGASPAWSDGTTWTSFKTNTAI